MHGVLFWKDENTSEKENTITKLPRSKTQMRKIIQLQSCRVQKHEFVVEDARCVRRAVCRRTHIRTACTVQYMKYSFGDARNRCTVQCSRVQNKTHLAACTLIYLRFCTDRPSLGSARRSHRSSVGRGVLRDYWRVANNAGHTSTARDKNQAPLQGKEQTVPVHVFPGTEVHKQ